MKCHQIIATSDQLIQMFNDTFHDSEGADEGRAIGDLVRSLLLEMSDDEVNVFSFGLSDDDHAIGACVFSKLLFSAHPSSVWLLAPVAVATAHQGKGIGQAMIRSALESMQTDHGAEIVLTYGDPAFYGRVGFRAIREIDAPAPFPLRYPEGWLGQHLNKGSIGPWSGPCRCVSAFNDPQLW